MRRFLVAAACCAVALAAAVGVHARDNRTDASTLVERTVRSSSIAGTLSYAVYLPAGYDLDPTRRYPVLYVLPGLPGSATLYRSLSFLLPVLDALDAQAIVVFPQGATDSDADDEYLDLGPGRNWE